MIEYRDGPFTVPDLVPVRMINEFAYCPRLAYLEWVQGEFADSADTVQGRVRHRRVDRERGGEGEEREATDEGEIIHARSLLLSAEKEGLIARMDIVEFDGNRATPVDYKRGPVPDIPERAWEPERVQLCAQGLILRENGFECDEGVLYFVESRTRVTIKFDEALITRTRGLVAGLRELAATGKMPPPLVDSPKCPRCSLVGICLPDETNVLKEPDSDTDEGKTVVRRLLPSSDYALPLYVQDQGATIGKSGERITVRRNGELLHEARLLDVSQVCLLGNVQVSTQAVRELAARGIPVLYFTYGGWFSAITRGFEHKNIELRIAQHEAARNMDRSLAIAKDMIAGKIYNCRTLLRRNHKGDSEEALGELQRLRDRVRTATSVETLLGIEGTAARVYFSHFSGMLRGDLAGEWDFRTRNRRPPRDPVNALLSLMYSLVIKDAAVALSAVGLDPYLGVYHAPKYGKPALALDLAEEFRPLLADSVVISVINNEEVKPNEFTRRAGGVALTDAARKRVVGAYERRMVTKIRHPLFGYTISYRQVLHVQARLLARTIIGELPRYPVFTTR